MNVSLLLTPTRSAANIGTESKDRVVLRGSVFFMKTPACFRDAAHRMNGGDFMLLNTSKLRELDVINVCDGRRLGWMCDFEVDGSCGRICAVFVSEKYFSICGQKNPLRIPWERVVCIGEDAVLVDCGKDAEPCGKEECQRPKRGLFG